MWFFIVKYFCWRGEHLFRNSKMYIYFFMLKVYISLSMIYILIGDIFIHKIFGSLEKVLKVWL